MLWFEILLIVNLQSYRRIKIKAHIYKYHNTILNESFSDEITSCGSIFKIFLLPVATRFA